MARSRSLGPERLTRCSSITSSRIVVPSRPFRSYHDATVLVALGHQREGLVSAGRRHDELQREEARVLCFAPIVAAARASAPASKPPSQIRRASIQRAKDFVTSFDQSCSRTCGRPRRVNSAQPGGVGRRVPPHTGGGGG